MAIFDPWMRGASALRLVRRAEGGTRPTTGQYYASMLRLHERLHGEVWSAEAWLEAGRTHLARGDLIAAEEALRQALVIGTPHPDAGWLYGTILFRLGHPGAAAHVLEDAVRHRPSHARAHHQLALVYRALGRSREELRQLRRAIEADPRFPEAWFQLGNCLSLRREEAEAIAAWRAALDADPDHVGALHNLGRVLARAGDREGALELWRRLERIDPETAALLAVGLEPVKRAPAGA